MRRRLTLFSLVATIGALAACSDSVNEVTPPVGAVKADVQASSSSFTTTDLALIGKRFYEATAINESGMIAGNAMTGDGKPNSGGYAHAVLWVNGKLKDLPSLGGHETNARGINEQGDVVGVSGLPSNKAGHGIFWPAGRGNAVDLGTLGGSYSWANAINAQRQIVGASYVSGNTNYHAFIWQNGVMTDIGNPFGDFFAEAVDVNDNGQVAGNFGSDFDRRPMIWKDGIFTDIGDGGMLDVFAINNAGTAVGQCIDHSDPFNPKSYPCMWSNGVTTAVGSCAGSEGGARAISEDGKISGYCFNAGNAGAHAFVWVAGAMTDLGALGAGATSSDGFGVNSAGWVVGYSFLNDTDFFTTHAVLWSLTP